MSGSSESGPRGEASQRRTERWYCHKCATIVSSVEEDFTCSVCHSGFLEKLDDTDINVDERDSSIPNPEGSNEQFNDFMQNLGFPVMQQLFQFPSSSQQPNQLNRRQNEGGQQHFNPLQGFMEQILNNLTNGGVKLLNNLLAFQVIVNQDEGGNGPLFLNIHGNLGDYALGAGSFDAIITQLLNQVEGGAPPMQKEKIESLPRVEISGEQVEHKVQCPVCFEEFKLAEVVRKLTCNHMFHDECIVPWLERHNSCPVCRTAAGDAENKGDGNEDITLSQTGFPREDTSASTSGNEDNSRRTIPRPDNPSNRQPDPLDEYD